MVLLLVVCDILKKKKKEKREKRKGGTREGEKGEIKIPNSTNNQCLTTDHFAIPVRLL
jgi:hypothetical protein